MIGAAEWLRAAEALPLSADPADLLGAAAPALIIAPHPDDESLGCGGLIAAACADTRLRPPLVVVLTDGAGSHPGSRTHPPDRLRALRAEEAHAAVATLGLPPGRLHGLGLPDGAAAAHADAAVERLLALLRDLGGVPPGAVLHAWGHDPHTDHAAGAEIAARLVRALRPVRPRRFAYPVWGWGFAHSIPGFPMPPPPTFAAPPRGLRLDVARHRPAKRRAVAAHASQATRLIADVDGFVLPAELLALADRPFEVFLDQGNDAP